jgi:ABC-2 type transport system permease protein
MASWLEGISAVLPLTYSYDALARVTGGDPLTDRLALDVGVTVGATLLALALGAATLRRRTA